MAALPNAVGSPYWMAPEIIELSTSPTTACDVWSLGCTLVELLTGVAPYFDLEPMAALFRIVTDDAPPLPSGASERCRDFLLRGCFPKEPHRRSTARRLLSHPWLLALASMEAAEPPQQEQSQQGKQEERRNRGGAAHLESGTSVYSAGKNAAAGPEIRTTIDRARSFRGVRGGGTLILGSDDGDDGGEEDNWDEAFDFGEIESIGGGTLLRHLSRSNSGESESGSTAGTSGDLLPKAKEAAVMSASEEREAAEQILARFRERDERGSSSASWPGHRSMRAR